MLTFNGLVPNGINTPPTDQHNAHIFTAVFSIVSVRVFFSFPGPQCNTDRVLIFGSRKNIASHHCFLSRPAQKRFPQHVFCNGRGFNLVLCATSTPIRAWRSGSYVVAAGAKNRGQGEQRASSSNNHTGASGASPRRRSQSWGSSSDEDEHYRGNRVAIPWVSSSSQPLRYLMSVYTVYAKRAATPGHGTYIIGRIGRLCIGPTSKPTLWCSK